MFRVCGERVLSEDGGVAEEEVEGVSEEGVCLKIVIVSTIRDLNKKYEK